MILLHVYLTFFLSKTNLGYGMHPEMKMNSLQLLVSKDSLKSKMYFSWKTKKKNDKTQAWVLMFSSVHLFFPTCFPILNS